jgi:hypothetical protein
VITGSGLNAFSHWLFVFGGMIAIAGFITPGGAAEFGWTGYTPLSDGLGTILGGVNTFPKSAVEQQLSRPAQPGGIVNVTNCVPTQFGHSVDSSLLHLDRTNGRRHDRKQPPCRHGLEMPTALRIGGQSVGCQIDCETCQLY